jgi:Cytochrome C oxidase, cbb3-type, subunit III
MTQWPGFSKNGDDILGLARNVGEVIGVFALFQPIKIFEITSFVYNASINFDGLARLENLIKKIGPPVWPGQLDTKLVAQGELIYQSSCAGCHGEKQGDIRVTFSQTWATPLQNVQTDTREHDVLHWEVDTGVLNGVSIPFVQQPLKPNDLAFNVLGTSVIGVIGEHFLTLGAGGAVADLAHRIEENTLPPALRELGGAFFPVPLPGALAANQSALPPRGVYESRVMHGIWATAPYLHNGSVPTLAELLKPAADRVKKFKIGPAYDLTNVGLAVEQTQFNFELETTDCSDANSGNSNCGHEYGTQLSADQKKALLEYLKQL